MTSASPLARAAFVLAASCALTAPLPCRAESPAPAKKDSLARTRPKDVAVAAAVTPAEVRPGGTVVLKVTAKLKPGFHIYTYSREENDVGPRSTRFDLFDAGGLVAVGDWTASKEPTRKKDPAFPDLDAVSYFEHDVTWSLTLKVPPDAAPGEKTLRCQASYQICDEKSCSFPGRWTLPAVAVTVLPSERAQASPAGGGTTPTGAAEATPKKKDGPAALVPPQVVVTPSLNVKEARQGDRIWLTVSAKIEPGWHVYDYARSQPDEGPRATEFDLFESSGLVPDGEWTSVQPPQVKNEPAFNNAPVAFFEDEATWTLPLKVPATASTGMKTVRVQIACQVCDARRCLPQARWTLPALTLVVSPSIPTSGGVTCDPNKAALLAASASRAGTPKAPTAPGPKPRTVSGVEKTAQQGVIPLMIASALGGLLALVMPCVWPMVPITVNFFVKQGQSRQSGGGGTTGLAVTYCLAIIGVFTAVGVLASFFVSATALSKLANNPWLNFAVAGLFLAFGLSLLGLFEITLPNALLNASARGESRGGLIGVVFMALTLTITSFTCTFPVVGGLLVMASTGQFFYPIVGLATFATVLALPFFLLALAPGLLSKMPRSGDWMNSVKVVGGLVEIGAAFKFLNTAELAFVTPENAWVDAQFVLTAWVVLAAVCGFYLLGFFRTDHDHQEVKIGPGRLVVGTAFLGMALFLAPALFGRPPQSLIWDRLVVGLLPPDASELSPSPAGASGPALAAEARRTARSADPDKAQREEERFHGVWWGFSYEKAVEQARAEGKPVLIDFTGVNCANCRLMESRVLRQPEVVELLRQFVTVQLYTDFVPIDSVDRATRESLAEKNLKRELDLTNDSSNPFYVIISPDETLLGAKGGYQERDVFLSFLKTTLAARKNAAEVALRK